MNDASHPALLAVTTKRLDEVEDHLVTERLADEKAAERCSPSGGLPAPPDLGASGTFPGRGPLGLEAVGKGARDLAPILGSEPGPGIPGQGVSGLTFRSDLRDAGRGW
ncbi:hypothetical protein [Mesorhizobium sp. LNHC229A00]|uniref:hypothetical protein n=1 Tax=Mesorhizobium sp. LNHC229A00 TaxID=1287240 RepID=UPI0003CEC732|nr:hypothetical protein [Mesorhizobium sp. LNHC229A00]ESY90664.1 hypothetical protein X741_26495 [Mesorhizobium sp. LNHC229A00]